MPTALVRSEVKRLGGEPLFDGQVEELARSFKVSEQAMTIRLATLGFL
jgi:hypothetical protein